ncbi:MAG: peptidase C14 caspase catalytic subunit P20, partial [Alphaproteobacteria bacterium]
MRMMRGFRALAAVAMAFVAFAAPAAAQQALNLTGRTQGELRQGDGALPSGEFVDDYTFTGRAGQRVVIRMTSSALDPYLIFSGPNNFQRDNDDVDANSKDAVI